MKLLFVALLAIVAVAESLRCEPNTDFQSYCNTCHCSPDGETARCSLRGCDTRIWNSDGSRKDGLSVQPRPQRRPPPRPKRSMQECVPHSTFKDYCNTCTCGADGKTMACTQMYCNPEVWNKDGTFRGEEPQLYCKPHSHFKDYCNSCICSRDGKTAVCTLMDCDPRVWNKDGTLKDGLNHDEQTKSQEPRKHVCEPHTIFKDYCNTCICGADGISMACTLMACDPTVWNKDGTRKDESEDLRCEPNSTFNYYCNSCKCSTDGKYSACTVMNCDLEFWNVDGTMKTDLKSLKADESNKIGKQDKETKKWGPLYEQGHRCTPGDRFYSKCNTCVCDRDGKSAFCTNLRC